MPKKPYNTNTLKRKERFLDNLKKYHGLISLAAEASGIDRSTIYDWKKSDDNFAKSMAEIQERVGDFVESKLLNNISKGLETSIIFYCKTKLRERGYKEKQEITGEDGSPMKVTFEVLKKQL